MTTVAVVQSNYIPWKGYFDIIHDVDTFVFYDDVQYTKNDWRNRNRIKTSQGVSWLTIPVGKEQDRRICDVRLPDGAWRRQHWAKLTQYYSRAPYFGLYREFFEYVYLDSEWTHLSALSQYLIRYISQEFLGIRTSFIDSREFHAQGNKLERLVQLLVEAGATAYVSGPAARTYIQEDLFARAGIQLRYKDYTGYPEYCQPYPPFEHSVSIVDLLFSCGPASPDYIWGWREAGSGTRLSVDPEEVA